MNRQTITLLIAVSVFAMAACAQQGKAKRPRVQTPREVTKVYFDFNRTTLSDDEASKLDKAVDDLRGHGNWVAQLEGHTDAIGSPPYNLQLGDRRARTVKAIMVMEGVSPEQLIILSFGEDKPIASNKTDEGRAQNRRVEVKIR